MPRGDRTGPMGKGAMTGHNAGYCAGFDEPGFANLLIGRGSRLGDSRGRGIRRRGWRNMFHATGRPGWLQYGPHNVRRGYPAPYHEIDPKWEERALRNQADMLQSDLDGIKKRLAEIESVTES